MIDSKLYNREIDPQIKEGFDGILNVIFNNIKTRVRDYDVFQNIINNNYPIKSSDLKDEQTPEEFTRKYVIEPMFEFLGYEHIGETRLNVPLQTSPGGWNQPDYKIRPKGKDKPLLLVEAEPLSKDLFNNKKTGINQVSDWLLSKASGTEYGIATNGFEWVVIKFDASSNKGKVACKFDLTALFSKINNSKALIAEDEIDTIKNDFLTLHSKSILSRLNGYTLDVEAKKEEISTKFYNDYVKYVFGYDNNGERIASKSLVDFITCGDDTPGSGLEVNKLFSVIFMNRLIFIKFLEEKEIVPRDFLKEVLKKYKSSESPSSIYEANLKPLFYDVFNKDKDHRKGNAKNNSLYSKIPYLNGGLFRESASIKNEKGYTIDDEGVELVINNLFKSDYQFGAEDSGINPDILGYIFEKTISYISASGTDQQKLKGAHYTPDDFVRFIIQKTLDPIIFQKMKVGLTNAGWEERDFRGIGSIEDILTQVATRPNAAHIKKMIEAIKTIKMLDPACGSGHFLTAMLSEMLRILEYLMKASGEVVDRYKLKREIISNNIFGVDIDENAVEIARLRLWLSIIQEVENTEHIETLPNIDYNVIVGNSLIGWIREDLSPTTLFNLNDDEYIKGTLHGLYPSYPLEVDDIKEALDKIGFKGTNAKNNLKNSIDVYRKFIDIYSKLSGGEAIRLRTTVEGIREKIYGLITSEYLDIIKRNTELDKQTVQIGKGKFDKKNKLTEISKKIMEKMKPFHWGVDFEKVLDEGGFDVIVGNPPYIEDGSYNKSNVYELDIIKSIISSHSIRLENKKINKNNKRRRNGEGQQPLLLSEADTSSGRHIKELRNEYLFYETGDCGNTHAYFTERAIKLLKPEGRFGFIVPLSLVSTDRMDSIRRFIHENSSGVEYYNFDDRPGKIFSGIEDCRATVVFTEKGTGVKEITTSKFHRWNSRDRPQLFDNLQATKWRFDEPGEVIPKIGTSVEGNILSKLNTKSAGKTIKDYMPVGDEMPAGERIWYHNAPRYWIHAHTEEQLPKVEYYDGYKKDEKTKKITLTHLKETKASSHYKFVAIQEQDAGIINGLINSSLFYWWFVTYSDGRDLLNQHITTFPINLDTFPADLRQKINRLTELLMESYNKKSNIKINERGKKYAIKIKEIIPSASKEIINQIDDVLLSYYGFGAAEKDFIKNFDLRFRIRENEGSCAIEENFEDNFQTLSK